MRKALFGILIAGGLGLGAFQNCSKANFGASSEASSNNAAFGLDSPSLLVTADPPVVNKGAFTIVSVAMNQIDSVDYACTPFTTVNVVTRGKLSPKSTSFKLAVEQDLKCTFTGTGTTLAAPIMASLDIGVACGAGFKTAAGTCQDFACQSVQILSTNALTVPARTAAGVCYAAKLISGVSAGASALTEAFDASILARAHGRAGPNAAPYLMGRAQVQFKLLGDRVVKLAGAANAAAPITVDNFILTGVYPADQAPNIPAAYRVRGTADASLMNGAVDTGHVSFQNVALPVEKFAAGGLSSIAPIDISSFVRANVPQALDVRALDCGGSRGLSDIYVLFQ